MYFSFIQNKEVKFQFGHRHRAENKILRQREHEVGLPKDFETASAELEKRITAIGKALS